MKVVHLSTSVSSASANYRLHCALQKQGIESCILVEKESKKDEKIIYAPRDRRRKLEEKTIGRFLDICLRRWYKLPSVMPFSHGQTGTYVSGYQEIQEADIIHLHWICHYQSVRTIKKLIATGKPIVWTCHDSWPFTGGCHVRYGCDRFSKACGKCPILRSAEAHDITRYILKTKRKHWKGNDITFIAPSKWMKKNINNSALFSANRCEVIPNAIDLETFCPLDGEEIQKRSGYIKEQEKVHLLFGAESAVTPYKGFSYLLLILEELCEQNPEFAKKAVLHIIGAEHHDAPILQKYECHYWGYVRDEKKMAAIYNIADIYVYPSIDDNLPNMIMESLACGTPVAAFDTGGISDMVEHKENGYIAAYKNTEELKEGILWICYNNQENCLGKQGRKKVEDNYGFERIAKQHIELYTRLLDKAGEEAGKR